MYNSSVYKIIFNESLLDMYEVFERLSYSDRTKVGTILACPFVEFDEYGCYTMLIITTQSEIEKYLNILSFNKIDYMIINISNDILRYPSCDIEASLRDKFCATSDFIEDLNIWIERNLSIDLILTKMHNVGFKYLRKVEKEFVKSYSGDQ